ncbi:MAG: hypothetical protein PUC65_05350 [Clostridiales bacterium]|nr:hypothetical protein [Clostridiales bacterium]
MKMKKIFKKISDIFEKIPIISYALIAFIKTFLIAVISIAVLYLILWKTGVYAILETALDLKYNSPIVIAPIYIFLALFIISFTIGFLMYFHRYKRRKSKSAFYTAIAPAFNQKK